MIQLSTWDTEMSGMTMSYPPIFESSKTDPFRVGVSVVLGRRTDPRPVQSSSGAKVHGLVFSFGSRMEGL